MKQKKATEKTIIRALVSYKCVGHFGNIIKPFSSNERARIIDVMINNNWLTENMQITSDGDSIVKKNLDLL